jgi:hypothetical protein
MKRCPNCNTLLVPPRMTPAQLVAALKLVQRNKPTIFHWPDSELARLESFLEPGDEITEIYCYSLVIVRASGDTVEFARHDNATTNGASRGSP